MWRLMLLAVLLLAGCGAQAQNPDLNQVSSTTGPFHAQVSPEHLKAGETAHVKLTVTGPIQFETGCVQTLHIWADDGQGRLVWEEPVSKVMCMAIRQQTLSTDETASFTADWPTSSRLADGGYLIHGLFLTVLPAGAGTRVRENMPPLMVTLSH